MLIRSIIFCFIFLLHPLTYAAANEAEFKIPFQYGLGKNIFEKKCASCHGAWGKGSEIGPPLMHRYYVKSHHNDASFYRAALSGVRAHHWKFGDMPAVPEMTRKKMDKVIPYLRWLQRQNGIQ